MKKKTGLSGSVVKEKPMTKNKKAKTPIKPGTNKEFIEKIIKPGECRNPTGRPKKENTYSDTLRDLLAGQDINVTWTVNGKKKSLLVSSTQNMYYGVAASQIMEALKGNVQAQKEIVDRIQGKAPQGIDITSQGDKINESPLTDKERALLADLLDNADSQ